MANNPKNVELTNFKLWRDNKDYYLSATYRYEDDRGIHELYIPKIYLMIKRNVFPTISIPDVGNGDWFTPMVDIGFGPACLLRGGDENQFVIDTLIKEKIHKLTINDIENKLGYRIEIIE